MTSRLSAYIIFLTIIIMALMPAVIAQEEGPPQVPGGPPSPPYVQQPPGSQEGPPSAPPPGYQSPPSPPNYGPPPSPPRYGPPTPPSPGQTSPTRPGGERRTPPSKQAPTPPREPKPQPKESAPILPKETLAVGEPTPGRDWTVFKGDSAHTGYTEERLSYPLKLMWRHVTERAPDNPSSPAVANGVAYFCSAGRIYAVNTETGSLKWRYPEEGLSANIRTSPLVANGLVYFGAGDGGFYAVSTETGTLRWSLKTKGQISSSPVLADGVIYVGASDNTLYALDAETGDMIWPGGFKTADDVACAPAYSDGLVYFLSNDMILYAAYAASGATKWAVRVAGVSRASTPVVADNTVYVGGGLSLHAFQAQSGRLKWVIRLPTDITTVPAVAGGNIYVGCRDGKLYAITSAGVMKWKEPVDVGEPIYGSPIVAGEAVILGANKGIIMVVHRETGEVLWKYVVQANPSESGKLRTCNVSAAPVVSHGTLYVVSDDGALSAFRFDMPDTTPPVIEAVSPPRDYLMPGTPPIEIAVLANDPGSGIHEGSIQMRLDGELVEHKFLPSRGIVYYKTKRVQPIVPLADGRHTVSVTLYDWAGNKTVEEWSFFVDNRLRFAPRKTQTGTGTTGTGETPPGPTGEGPPPGFQ